jgi:hypothetical protein
MELLKTFLDMVNETILSDQKLKINKRLSTNRLKLSKEKNNEKKQILQNKIQVDLLRLRNLQIEG